MDFIGNMNMQSFPRRDASLQRIDPRVKLLGFAVTLALVFLLKRWYDLIGLELGLLLLILISGVPMSRWAANLIGILPFLLLAALFNCFLVPGEILWQWSFLKLTREGLWMGAIMGLKIVIIITAASLLTLTTSYLQLTDALESFLRPWLKSLAHEVALMMGIALRFLPLLTLEAEKIFKAQLSRGADFESGSWFRRLFLLLPLLLPLFIHSFRTSEELALAMESRCYTGGEGRTRLRELRIKPHDYLALAFLGLTVLIFWGGEWLSGILK